MMRASRFVFLSLLVLLLFLPRSADGAAAETTAPGLSAPRAPVLEVESPPSLAALAARVRGYDPARLAIAMRLTGLDDAGPPIGVLLAPEGSEAARAAPSWAEGYANGARGVIVLIPARSSSYPHGSLEALLHHEVAHVLIARAAGGRPVPRWFNEGLAMAAAREWDLEDRTRLVVELLPGGRVDLQELNALFARGSGEANRAYALSGAFVRDILQRYGMQAPARTLALMARGVSFEESFSRATGATPDQALGAFYATQNIWSRWVPFLTSSFTLWMGITALFLWAVRKRRRKDAMKKVEWEREEAAREEAARELAAREWALLKPRDAGEGEKGNGSPSA